MNHFQQFCLTESALKIVKMHDRIWFTLYDFYEENKYEKNLWELVLWIELKNSAEFGVGFDWLSIQSHFYFDPFCKYACFFFIILLNSDIRCLSSPIRSKKMSEI